MSSLISGTNTTLLYKLGSQILSFFFIPLPPNFPQVSCESFNFSVFFLLLRPAVPYLSNTYDKQDNILQMSLREVRCYTDNMKKKAFLVLLALIFDRNKHSVFSPSITTFFKTSGIFFNHYGRKTLKRLYFQDSFHNLSFTYPLPDYFHFVFPK